MPVAVLAGHSLGAARISHPDIPLDFDLKTFEIQSVAKGGAKVEIIRSKASTISRLRPDIVFQQVGGSDICYRSQNVISVANKAWQQIYIGEMLFRFKRRYIKSIAEQNSYNEQIHAANL